MLDKSVKDERQLLMYMSYGMLAVSVYVFSKLQVQKAPYGRYSSALSGIAVPAKWAWFVMELPAFLVPLCIIVLKEAPKMKIGGNCVLIGMFLTHYFQRALIFPFLLRGGKAIPMGVFLPGLMFCLYNGYLQGHYLSTCEGYADDWLQNSSVRLGIALFFTGMAINIHSDHVLRHLRKPGETGYKIPSGGMFKYVSGANFFGEIVEWFGFFVACQSLPSFAFFVFTAANIGPRAVDHHRWYQKKFADTYPKNRKALIPFIL